MKYSEDFSETFSAGDTASIENTDSQGLSISIISGDGCRLDI